MKNLLFIFMIFLITGCASYTGVKGLEPYSKPIASADYEVIEVSSGESSSFTLFWVWTVTKPASYERALNNAILKHGGDNLIEAQYYHTHHNYALGKIDIITVKGKVIRYK